MSNKQPMTCGTCYWWHTENGTPYCLMKDLYTYTRRNHPCDERMIGGEYYYSNKHNNEQHEENQT